MSSLELDDHAQDKLCRLLGDRFNPETGEITLVSERCPLRQQNHEHGQYLLTALYFESWVRSKPVHILGMSVRRSQ